MSDAVALATPQEAPAPTPRRTGVAGRPHRLPALRLLLLLPGGLALLAGLDAALILLGLPAPVRVDRLPQVHGMLLVLGGILLGQPAVQDLVAGRRARPVSTPVALVLDGAGAIHDEPRRHVPAA